MTLNAFPSADVLTLRRLTLNDVSHTLRVFRDAVRRGTEDYYSEAERSAWAPSIMEAGSWMRRRLAQPTWVAEIRGAVVGFCDLTRAGFVLVRRQWVNLQREQLAHAVMEKILEPI